MNNNSQAFQISSKKNRKIHYVVFRYSHHSPHSGYSRIAEYGLKTYSADILPVSKPLSRFIIRDRIYWRLAKGTPGYTRAAMAAELKVAMRILGESGSIFHYLYGETTYHYTGRLNNHNNNRIVATFHLPPIGIQAAWLIDSPLKQLSAAICVGSSQLEYLGKIVGHDKVFLNPLGVDLEYYTAPDFESRDPNLCIFIGENYRDFPTLRGMIELVAYLRPKTRFIGVIPAHSFDLIGEHPNITLLSKVPESKLLELYRTASLMVLPLKDATANNAVLESMACGLPMVITDIGSVRDYVSEDCAVLVPPSNACLMAKTVLGLLEEQKVRQRMAEKAREHAQKFSWPKVADQLLPIYEAIA